MNRHKAPLYDRLVEHHNRRTASFHVPGHKSGQGLDPAAESYLGSVMELDVTEISGLDDLHQPEGVIKEAQALAAQCFGAEESFFLVNGSTAGNLAMILSVCAPGDLLLVQRTVHKSVLNGLALAGARAVFLTPEWDEASGLTFGVSVEEVERALAAYPEAKGLFLTNPTYYGLAADLTELARLAHSHGIPLLVDEAHGAHFGFHPDLPPSALSCGADAVVQSTHKMLTALTMGGMLHLQGSRVNRHLIRHNLGVVQSSSPSYPLMASLDLSRRQLHTRGEEWIESGLRVLRQLRREIREMPDWEMIDRDEAASYSGLDPFKLTLRMKGDRLSGFELQGKLEACGCMTEMANIRYVLLCCSLATTKEEADRLLEALHKITREEAANKQENGLLSTNIPNKPIFLPLSAPVSFARPVPGSSTKVKTLELEQCTGRVAAEMVIPYPPGIPVLYPGERITAAAVKELAGLRDRGARFQGARDPQLRTLQIEEDGPNGWNAPISPHTI
ncbi:aminotransferase class I/II-fold pyridoxal phosphate-dependent enzyme [Paenibacillus sp. CC-CFT747]|nr:aminotransferase class I/II-fold pyridoxal phosphate-dependent enzyme [Paenibacillus sp. CC-CFT747]